MTFATWLASKPLGTLADLCRATGISYNTLHAMKRGRAARGRTAQLVSDATRPAPDEPPAVSIAELVCPTLPLQAPAPKVKTAVRRSA